MQFKHVMRMIFMLAVLIKSSTAQEVIVHADASQTLQQRWNWANEQSKQARFQKGFWIGYSIKRTMEESSTIGRMNLKNGRVERGPGKSLSELIYGIEMPLPRSRYSDAKLRPKVIKDLGLFLQFSPRMGALVEIKESTFELSVDFESLALFWLGPASDESSFALLEKFYRQAGSAKIKEELLSAVGLHNESVRRRIFLAGILAGNEAVAVRKQAAFWLGQGEDLNALHILQQTAKSDRAIELRKQAVFALSQMHAPEAEEILVALARNANDREIRKEALFWLAQKASKRATALLKEIAQRDTDTEIQKQAIFALSQLPQEEGIPLLIEIAEHHNNTAVRKEAIFWLGQSDDTRATAALIKLVRGKE